MNWIEKHNALLESQAAQMRSPGYIGTGRSAEQMDETLQLLEEIRQEVQQEAEEYPEPPLL